MMKILPINGPLVKAYKHHAFILSMMQDTPEHNLWILSNYIQIFSAHDIKNDPYCNWHWLDFLIIGNESPFMSNQVIPLSELQSYDLAQFIKETLDRGNYLYIFCESYYLAHHTAYQKEYLPNNVLVYGYNEDSDNFTVNILDYAYAGSRKLEKFIIGLDILKTAILKFDTRGHTYAEYSSVFTPVKASYEMNLPHVKELLNDYLHSLPTFAQYTDNPFFDKAICGIKTYESFLHYFNWLEKDQTRLNILPFCILEEHKVVLLELSKLLFSMDILKNEEIIDRLQEIKKEATQLKTFMLLFETTGRKNLIKRMESTVKKMQVAEEQCITYLLESI